MKYLLILSLSLMSHLAFSSYHGGSEGGDGSSDDGYGSGSSAAAGLVAVGVVAYFIFRNKDDESTAEFSNNFLSPESDYQLVMDFEKSTPFTANGSLYDPSLEKDFQFNLKFRF